MNSSIVLEPTTTTQQSLSPVLIGIIVISIVAGLGLTGLTYLLIRRRQLKNDTILEEAPSSPQKKKRVFSFSSHSEKDVPVTSSLDDHHVYGTILDYPPTKPPLSLQNHHALKVPVSAHTTCSSYSVYEERKKLLNAATDPISASLVRQSIEERSGYYKSPFRTPVPYYHHTQSSLAIPTQDEDEKAMQKWSDTSYHVW